ncbi:MAG: acetylxylan esterase [Bryobacterales bacterium]|nr:acetylxylan esterase [Bryobacterales bacterium]
MQRSSYRARVVAGLGSLVLMMPVCLRAQTRSEPAGDMLRGYLQRIAMEQLAARRQRIASIRTGAQFEQRKAEVRRQLLSMMGGLPTTRGPLNLRRTGTLQREGYRVEKVIYESLPNFFVTANLYVPETGKPPYPAILHPTGHSLTAKTRAFYQSISLGLVKNGFVVLTYDPTGQGERRIFYDRDLGDSKVGGTTVEHEMVGIQSLLGGESIARYMVWDGMRGIDLLESLPYVNGKRIGVAGCSGGGTLTAYIAALDPRVAAAAPACYITDWEDQLLGTGPQDAEQQFPDQLKAGLNHADLVEAFAPKPYLIASTTEDFFPIGGSRKAFAESKRFYEMLGAADRISTFVAAGGHGVPPSQREAIEKWMSHWLKDAAARSPEPAFRTEQEEDLLCTVSGQLATSIGGDTPSTLNVRRLSRMTPPRRRFDSAGDVYELRTRLREQIVRLTRYERSKNPLNGRSLPSTERDGYRLTSLTYETGPGRIIPAVLAEPVPERSRKRTVLYLDERGKSAAMTKGGDVEQLTRLGYTVLAIDPSGTGEAASRWDGYSQTWFGQGKVTWLALMVGKTMTGLRIDDILRGVDLLEEKHLLEGGKCAAYARGNLGADLLHAAVLDERISVVGIEGGLLSYAAVARAPLHRRVFEAVIPGVLGRYDLPDLAAAIAPRALSITNARSAMGMPVFLREARAEYEYAGAAYGAVGKPEQFRVGLRREDEEIADAFPVLR